MNTITRACILGVVTAAAMMAATKQANAGVIAYFPNEQGGRIQLLDTPCPTQKGMGVIVGLSSAGVLAATGCWKWEEPNIVARWSDGDDRFYSTNGVVITSYGAKVVAGNPM